MNRLSLACVLGLLGTFSLAHAQTGSVVGDQKVSATEGGFTPPLRDRDFFGGALAYPGDLDGDGVSDLYVGMPGGDRGGLDTGAFWTVYLNPDGTVKGQVRTNAGRNGFDVQLDYTDALGSSIACIGDMNGDGVEDLALGVPGHDGGPFACSGFVKLCNYGGYWVLFMNEDGSVGSSVSNLLQTGFGSALTLFGDTGAALAPLGDLNGDGVVDLAVGQPGFTGALGNNGAFLIVFQNANGKAGLTIRLSSVSGFPFQTRDGEFGKSLANIGDLDGDGVTDLAVGAPEDREGVIYTVFLNNDGTVKSARRIRQGEGGFGGALSGNDRFGSSITNMGDLDGDGVVDLAVGAERTDDGGTDAGATWILFMNSNGTVKDELKISEGNGGLGELDEGERFGSAVAPLGDLDGDGVTDMAVGAYWSDDAVGENGVRRGAFHVLFLDGLANLDFEDGVNGEQVGGGPSSTVVGIEGFPSSGLTAALFDSDPAGPNALGGDPDLLVDSGNVLILQGVAGQSVPGIYDVPNDDRFGGVFVVDFGGLDVAPQSVDLIDLCPEPSQSATVTLIDSKGLTRTYFAPSGWTEDVSVDGPPGTRTLDLTTLADQPGFNATATASQDAGFSARSVVMIEILLGGSGAIDNLSYDPNPDPPVVVRDPRKFGRSAVPTGSTVRLSR